MSAQTARTAGPQRPGLRVVRRRSGRGAGSGRRLTLMLLGILGVVAVVFAVLLEQVMLAQSAFRLAAVRDQLAAQERQQEKLVLEAARLGSPNRIERYARRHLGMVDPQDVEYIIARLPRPEFGPVLARHRRPGKAPLGTSAASP